jgi:hypothetical protein
MWVNNRDIVLMYLYDRKKRAKTAEEIAKATGLEYIEVLDILDEEWHRGAGIARVRRRWESAGEFRWQADMAAFHRTKRVRRRRR